jgi:hypothetical protein
MTSLFNLLNLLSRITHMPSYKQIQRVLRNDAKVSSKLKQQPTAVTDNDDEFVRKVKPPRNNLQYPSGETLQLSVTYAPTRDYIINKLHKKLNLTITESECINHELIFNNDWCIAHGRTYGGPLHTGVTLYSCSNDYNTTHVNDRPLMLDTLRDSCIDHTSSEDIALVVAPLFGSLCLIGSLVGFFRKRQNDRQRLAQPNGEIHLQERLNPNP